MNEEWARMRGCVEDVKLVATNEDVSWRACDLWS